MSNNDEMISINILHYNNYEKTKVCVDSCLKQTDESIQIIIIDNNSSNDSLGRLKSTYTSERVVFLCNDENFGFAKGNNIGVDFAIKNGIKYSFLLNNDTESVGEDLITEMIRVIKTHTNCAVVAPQIFDVTKSGLELLQNDSAYLELLRFFKILPNNRIISDEIEELSEAQGAALLVDNQRFKELLGFPEHYFMYGEESTFSKKVLWSGYKILWYKKQDSYVLHHHDKSGKIDPWRLYLMGRNRGIEYYENNKRNPLWGVAYLLFYAKELINYKSNVSYIAGMKEAHLLHKKHVNGEIYYLDGLEARDKYGSIDS